MKNYLPCLCIILKIIYRSSGNISKVVPHKKDTSILLPPEKFDKQEKCLQQNRKKSVPACEEFFLLTVEAQCHIYAAVIVFGYVHGRKHSKFMKIQTSMWMKEQVQKYKMYYI